MPKDKINIYNSTIQAPGTTIHDYDKQGLPIGENAPKRGKPVGMVKPKLAKKKVKIRNKMLKHVGEGTGLVVAGKTYEGKIVTGKPGMIHAMLPDARESSGFRDIRSGEYLTRLDVKTRKGFSSGETYTIATAKAQETNPYTESRRYSVNKDVEKVRRQRKNTQKAFTNIKQELKNPATSSPRKHQLMLRRGALKNLSRKAGLLSTVVNTGSAISAAKAASKEKGLSKQLWMFSERFLGLPPEIRRKYGPKTKQEEFGA